MCENLKHENFPKQKFSDLRYQLTVFFAMVGMLYHSHPHVAHVAELGAVKILYRGKVFEMDKLKQEMDKLKQKLEASQTSVTKVCSLLVVLFLTMSSFHGQVGIHSVHVFSLLFQ